MQTQILIVGGGAGGCAAAMAACGHGAHVVMTEPTPWVGGQLTSQMVPPDENPWIEDGNCTAHYADFRRRVRRHYHDHFPLTAKARTDAQLNPGGGSVSRLCCEPKVALAVLQDMLRHQRLTVLLHHQPIAAETDGDRVRSVTFRDGQSGEDVTIEADYILDATEGGDLLPLAGVEHVKGAESRDETGELHAVAGPAQPDNVQSVTWCAALAYDPAPGADPAMDKPAQYDLWRNHVPPVTPPWSGRQLSFKDCHPHDAAHIRSNYLMPDIPPPDADEHSRCFWLYRQLVTRANRTDDPHEVTCVNWPMNDYLPPPPPDGNADDMNGARQLTLSLIYWLKTEAPNFVTGENGYRGLYLRPDIAGTDDGLAMAPYIREARRIRPVFTVTEAHVGAEMRDTFAHAKRLGADPLTLGVRFDDSIGIGYYRIDLHPSTSGCNYIDVDSVPFQVPLGALIPRRATNLLAAGKTVGCTHIANGCLRLHPVEWNIGEAAGLLAAFCLARNVTPHAVHGNPDLLGEFQSLADHHGIRRRWPWQE